MDAALEFTMMFQWARSRGHLHDKGVGVCECNCALYASYGCCRDDEGSKMSIDYECVEDMDHMLVPFSHITTISSCPLNSTSAYRTMNDIQIKAASYV
jgi:hypothetical protein